MTKTGAEGSWHARVAALHAVHADRVLSYLVYASADRTQAEEIAQEVWVRVCEAFRDGRYREDGSFEAWLFTIARNLWLNRKARRRLAPGDSRIDEDLAVLGGRLSALSADWGAP